MPDPPDFTKCIAAAKKAAGKPAEGQPKQTDADYKKQCQQQYDQLREQVVGLLINYQWLQSEAEEQGVKVSDDEVQKSFDEQKKQAFPKAADYEKFLKDSGQTKEDVLMRVRMELLSNKIRDKVTKGKDKVTDQQIKDYYDKNKAQFAQPERRDLSIVLTKTKAKADEAKAALESGESFKTVAKEYSIDDASKAQGGKLPAVAKGQQEKAFDDAIFKARRARSRARSRRSSATTSSRSTRSTRRRSRRSSRPSRRSSSCWRRRTSRRRSTRSSRTSASGGRTRRSAARTTRRRTARTRRRRRRRRPPARSSPADPTATPQGQ